MIIKNSNLEVPELRESEYGMQVLRHTFSQMFVTLWSDFVQKNNRLPDELFYDEIARMSEVVAVEAAKRVV